LDDTTLNILTLLSLLVILAVIVDGHVRYTRLRSRRREDPEWVPSRRELVLSFLWPPVAVALTIPVFAIAGRWDMVVLGILCIGGFAFVLYLMVNRGRYDRRGD
jgi:hypothetical protein